MSHFFDSSCVKETECGEMIARVMGWPSVPLVFLNERGRTWRSARRSSQSRKRETAQCSSVAPAKPAAMDISMSINNNCRPNVICNALLMNVGECYTQK